MSKYAASTETMRRTGKQRAITIAAIITFPLWMVPAGVALIVFCIYQIADDIFWGPKDGY